MRVLGNSNSALWRKWSWGLLAAASLQMSALAGATEISAGKSDAAPLKARQHKAGDTVAVAVSELPAGMSVGPASVQVRLTAEPGIDALQLSYAVEGALRVEAAAPTKIQLDAQQSAVVEIPFTVLASGVHYLHVHVQAGARYSAFAVRVDAGAVQGAYKAMRQSRQMLGSEFVEMPAQETRRH